MGENPSILRVVGVSKGFPGVQALTSVNLDVRVGEVHVLLGENGAGKSTLIKILSGVYQPDAGVIYLDGQPVDLTDPHTAQALGIATIHQEFNLVSQLSVAENIFLGQIPASKLGPLFISPGEMHRQASLVLARLGLHVSTQEKVAYLSPGERKLIEIARALRQNLRVLIMDEPTAALSAQEVDRLFEIIRLLQDQGVAIIYISHRIEELHRIGDRVTVLRDGHYIAMRPIASTTVDELIRLMVGRELTEVFPKRVAQPGAEVLCVNHLSRPGAFSDISFSLHAGEILGLAGLIGSGRTELARAIFGAEPYESGEIHLHGKAAKIKSPGDAIRRGMSLLPADRKAQGLVLSMPVKHNVTLAALDRLSRWGWLGLRQEASIVRRYAQELSIRPSNIDVWVKYLSGGNQQKVALARALYCQSKILFFDEPTLGIDVGAKAEVYRLLDELAHQGAAILMISSDMQELMGLSDRILVMRHGRITGEFLRQEATQEEILRRAVTDVETVA